MHASVCVSLSLFLSATAVDRPTAFLTYTYTNQTPSQVGAKNLGEVYLRLGDLQRTNGNYVQAIDDYHKALRLYTQAVPEDDRNIADVRVWGVLYCVCGVWSDDDVAAHAHTHTWHIHTTTQLHYLLATSYIFASADQTDKVVELKQQALEHFSKVRPSARP